MRKNNILYLLLFFCSLPAETFASHHEHKDIGLRCSGKRGAGSYAKQDHFSMKRPSCSPEIEEAELSVAAIGLQSRNNALTEQEKAQGWELLFDGKDPSSQWRSSKADGFPKNGWTVEDESLVLLPGNEGGDIITRQSFRNFELVLDYKLTDSANTGIKYFVSELKNLKGKTELNGLEFQLIDDFKHESVVGGKSPETSTGSLYLLYAPTNKIQNGAGEWNQAKIIANGSTVEHWLNGVKILAYTRGTEEFRKLVGQTKFKEYIDYGEVATGYILLQDHHDKASFRNIKIRRIE